MSSSWTDKAGRKYDEEFGANVSKNGNIEIQDDTMDQMEDDDLEAGPDPYKDRIIGGKKRIPVKLPSVQEMSAKSVERHSMEDQSGHFVNLAMMGHTKDVSALVNP